MKQLLLVAIKCKANPNSGFSLLEALVGIFVITTFTLAALQALALAATFRVKAEQKSGATNWIQERVEQVKFEAFQLELSGDNDPTTNDQNTDADGDEDSTTPGPAQRCGNAPTSNQNNGYGAALQTVLPPGTGGNSGNWTIINNNEDEDVGRGEIPGKTIWLLRNATAKNQQPFQVLELEYRAVLDDGSGNPSTKESDIVAELYTEVIPDEAFACD